MTNLHAFLTHHVKPLHTGQFDNLHVELENYRLWASRVDGTVTLERLMDGKWEVTLTIPEGECVLLTPQLRSKDERMAWYKDRMRWPYFMVLDTDNKVRLLIKVEEDRWFYQRFEPVLTA